MATFRGIRAACEAVLKLLETRYDANDFSDSLEFKSYLQKNFAKDDFNGVSLYLYRITINTSHRIPAGRINLNGQRHNTRLPLDLHIILTIWADSAESQMEIAGWMMRVLEDHPIIPASILNSTIAGVFQNDEAVDLIIGELAQEDLLHIWETLRANYYQLSIPYVIRNLRIDSPLLAPADGIVQDRSFDYTTRKDEDESFNS